MEAVTDNNPPAPAQIYLEGESPSAGVKTPGRPKIYSDYPKKLNELAGEVKLIKKSQRVH
jgi:hypothetical protein